jgi:hypothetical protein
MLQVSPLGRRDAVGQRGCDDRRAVDCRYAEAGGAGHRVAGRVLESWSETVPSGSAGPPSAATVAAPTPARLAAHAVRRREIGIGASACWLRPKRVADAFITLPGTRVLDLHLVVVRKPGA